MIYGLKESDIERIKMVFTDFPAIEKAILYGSRAKGNYRDGSDIDLTLVGVNIDFNSLLKIENKLDDLLLPYNIDLSIFSKLENLDLINHIESVGEIIYDREGYSHEK